MEKFIKKAEESFIFLYSFMYITLTTLLTIMCIGLFINYNIKLQIEKKQNNIKKRIEIVKEEQLELSYQKTRLLSNYVTLMYENSSVKSKE